MRRRDRAAAPADLLARVPGGLRAARDRPDPDRAGGAWHLAAARSRALAPPGTAELRRHVARRSPRGHPGDRPRPARPSRAAATARSLASITVRPVLPISLATAGLLLAGCGQPAPPEVTFYSWGQSIVADPQLYCQPEFNECQQDRKAAARLRVPAGEPLQISVPAEVADAPWVAVFRYRKPDGKRGPESRTPLFEAGSRHAYTLRPPGGGDQLTEVQIHRVVGLQPPARPGGDMQFVSDATWALRTE
ncbi:MAG: DUF2771 family protein [Pseudonocardiaceae bacterium]|nr:DUF2771 family protein [Pseudonocardiaceae bacterium]